MRDGYNQKYVKEGQVKYSKNHNEYKPIRC